MDTRKGFGRSLPLTLSKPDGTYRATPEELAAMREECPLSGVYLQKMAQKEAGASDAHHHTKRRKRKRSP